MSPDDALWWQKQTTGSTGWSAPTPTRDQYDDVVVGGGIVGFSAAVALAEAGHRVAVVEAHDAIGTVTTGLSTGKLTLLQGSRLSSIRKHVGRAGVRDYVDTLQWVLPWIDALAEETGLDVERRRSVTWADGARSVHTLQQEKQAADEVGLQVEWLDSPVLDLGIRADAAITMADQRQVDPLAYLRAVADRAVELGVDVFLGHRVDGVDDAVGGVEVSSRQGLSLRADRAILATGLPVLDRTATFALAKPYRSYAIAFSGLVEPIDSMLSLGMRTRSLRDATGPAGERVLVVGGEGHTVGRGGPTGPRLDALRQFTHDYRPGLTELGWWSAQDYSPARALPLWGRSAVGPEVHVLTGFDKWGLVAGVGYARRLATAITAGEDVPRIPTSAVPDLRSAGTAGLVNAEVGAHLGQGWAKAMLTSASAPAEGEGVVSRGLPRPTATSTVDGCTHSVSAACTHLGGIVTWNDAEQSWDCPLHGSRFAPDGSVIEGPATAPLRTQS